MKAFKTHNQVLTLMCILPVPDDTALWKKIFRLIFGFTVSMSVTCGLVSSIVYVSKYAGDNLEESVKTIFQIAAYANVTYMMGAAFLKQRKIKEVLKRFQETFDTNKGKASYEYLMEANDKSERLTIIFMQMCFFFFLMTTIMGFLLILYSHIKYEHFDPNNLFLPYNYVDFLDRSSMIGWTLEYIYQDISGGAYLLISMVFASFFICVCLHNIALCKQLQAHLMRLQFEQNEGHHQGKRILSILCKFVQFHTSTKEIIWETIDLFSVFILIQLLGGVIHIASCIFQLDLALQKAGLSTILAVVCVCWSSANTFFYCFFGNLITETLLQINKWLYDSDWHRLRNEHQKFYIMLLANSQKPLYFHGFGIANLTLETYAKIMRSVGSYYMAFKAVASQY